MPYIHMVTGKEFTGRIPRVVSASAGEERGKYIVSVERTATVGDPDYHDVLQAWLYAQGYIWEGRNPPT